MDIKTRNLIYHFSFLQIDYRQLLDKLGCIFTADEIDIKENLNYQHTIYEILYSHFTKHPEFPCPSRNYQLRGQEYNPNFIYSLSRELDKVYLPFGKINFCHSQNPRNGLFDPEIVLNCLNQALLQENVLLTVSNPALLKLLRDLIEEN